MDRTYFLDFQKGIMIAFILIGHLMQFYVYSGSEGYWTDPFYKGLYIFCFAYYMAINGYIASEKLTSVGIVEVIKFKFVQYIMPLFFWCAFILVTAPLYKLFGRPDVAPISALWQILNSYWLLWSDIFAVILIRLLNYIPIRPYITLGISLVVMALIPNGGRLSMLSMIKYAYIGVCAGYIMGICEINLKPRWWKVVLMLPVCATIYAFWTQDTYIYLNRLNYLDPEPRLQTLLMIAGTLSFIFVAYAIIKPVYKVVRNRPALLKPIVTLSKLNSIVIMFEVVFFYTVNHSQLLHSGSYAVDLLIGFAGTFMTISLIPLTFKILKPGSLPFRLVWGTTANIGEPRKNA